MDSDSTAKLRWVLSVDGFSAKWLVEPSITVLEDIARQYLQVPDDEPIKISFFDEGAFNKLYKITGSIETGSYLLRVALPVCPHFKTASEVATIRYVQQRTHIPVRIIVAYDSTEDNALGFEWMLMEMLPGKPLDRMWRHLAWPNKRAITRTIAGYQAQLFNRVNRFDSVGSLYSARTAEPSQDEPHGGLPPQPFKVGRIVDRDFIDGDHVDETLARGPYKTTTELIKDRLQAFLNYFEPAAEQEDLSADDGAVVDSGLTLVKRLTEMLPQLIPEEEETIKDTVLWHWDLDKQNILVDDDGNVTGIIDWECCTTMPLWQASACPRFLGESARHIMPKKTDHPDANPHDPDDNPEGLDNEGKTWIYWEHMEEYESTQLRKHYDHEMGRRCPCGGSDQSSGGACWTFSVPLIIATTITLIAASIAGCRGSRRARSQA